MIEDKKPVYYLEVDFNDDTAALVYLSVVHKIDLAGLLYLYDRYDKDVFFLFFLFAGKELKLPKATKYEKINALSSEFRDIIMDGRDYKSAVGQEMDAFLTMETLFDGEGSLRVPVYA